MTDKYIPIAIIVAIAAIVGSLVVQHQRSKECEARGGVFLHTRGGFGTCVKRDAVINLGS